MTRREWIIAVLAALLGIGLARGYDVLAAWLEIDACLDSGGRWSDETARCEH